MNKVVGLKIDTKSLHTKDKVYYYTTNKDLKRGDSFRIKVPSGGSPVATVTEVDKNSNKQNLKSLKQVK